MGAKLVHTGFTIDYTPTVAILAGSVIVQNDLVGVANLDMAASRKGALHVAGVFDFPKAAEAIAVGVKLYWDADGDPVGGEAGSGAVTATATDNTYIGKAIAAAADTDTHVRTRMSQ